MVWVVLHWAFIAIVLYGMGWWCRGILRNLFFSSFDALHPLFHFLLGVILLISGCNILSFFMPIGWMASVVGVILSLAAYLAYKTQIQKEIRCWWKRFRDYPSVLRLAFLFYIVIALPRAAGQTEVLDEGGYHMPLLRWIENYPVVPGIANIEDRMGFNPSKYMADAFFSLSWCYPGGLYELNSFFFLLFNGFFLGAYSRLMRGISDYFTSDLIAVAASVFLWRQYLSAVDADYLNIFTGLIILIVILRQLEMSRQTRCRECYLIAMILFIFILSVKFSSVILAFPLVILFAMHHSDPFNKRYWSGIAVVFVALLLPWMLRNYFLSGYPIYPLYFFTIGSPDWQVLSEIAKGQYLYVTSYARDQQVCFPNQYYVQVKTLPEWFPGWWKDTFGKLTGKIAIIGILGSTANVLMQVFRSEWTQKRRCKTAFQVSLLLATVIWFFKAPALRFFWGGLMTLAVLPVVSWAVFFMKKWTFWFKLALMIWLFFGLFRGILYPIHEQPDWKNWLHAIAPPTIKEGTILIIDNYKVHVAKDNQCHGTLPPCLPADFHRGIQFRGTTIEDGFRVKQTPQH